MNTANPREFQAAASTRAAEAIKPSSDYLDVPESDPLRLDCNKLLAPFRIAYKTYGELNAAKSNAILVAHAVGSSMALRLSYRFPGRVRALLSLDGGPAERAATPGFRRAMRFAPFVKLFGGVKLVRKKLREQLISQSGDTSWVTDAVVDGYTAGHARDLDGTLKAYLRMADAREPEALAPNLGRISVPVRLLIGLVEHSGVPSREEMQLLTTRLPEFTVNGVAGAGHFLHEERPDVVLAAVVALAQSRPRLVRGDE